MTHTQKGSEHASYLCVQLVHKATCGYQSEVNRNSMKTQYERLKVHQRAGKPET